MMHRANYDYIVIYRQKQGGGSAFRFLSPPWCVCTRPHYLIMDGPGCQPRVDAAALDVVRWATGGPAALAADHHGGRAPHKLPEMQRPRRGEGAARRARPKPAPGALLAQHPATPAGVAGRIGGTPPGGAAPPPHLGSGWARSGLWPGLNKISLFCTLEGPWLGGPQPTTRTLSARPSQALEALVIAG